MGWRGLVYWYFCMWKSSTSLLWLVKLDKLTQVTSLESVPVGAVELERRSLPDLCSHSSSLHEVAAGIRHSDQTVGSPVALWVM